MNENNRRGEGVGGCLLPHSYGRDTGMATRPPPASNLKARNAWVSTVPARTEKARSYAQSSAHRTSAVRWCRHGRSRSQASQINRPAAKATQRALKGAQSSGGDTYLYATIHNVESINQTAGESPSKREGADVRAAGVEGLLHNIHSLGNPSASVSLCVIPFSWLIII